MAIVKDLTIKVNGDKSSISKPIYLYLGDGAITLLIKIVEANFIIGTTDNELNIVEQANTVFESSTIFEPSDLNVPNLNESSNTVISNVMPPSPKYKYTSLLNFD